MALNQTESNLSNLIFPQLIYRLSWWLRALLTSICVVKQDQD